MQGMRCILRQPTGTWRKDCPIIVRGERSGRGFPFPKSHSALYHGKALITLGRAFYDFPGLTFQGELKDFWRRQNQVDTALWRRFRAFLIAQTQLNASYHGRDFLSVMLEQEKSFGQAEKTAKD